MSCTSKNNYFYKVDFKQKLKNYTFDTEDVLKKDKTEFEHYKKYKGENEVKILKIKTKIGKSIKFKNKKEIKIIRIENINDIFGTLARMSVELKGYVIPHYVNFSTNEKFFVYEDVLKEYAKSKNSDILVYTVANDVLRYHLYNDYKTIEIIEKKGYKLFNAFLVFPFSFKE